MCSKYYFRESSLEAIIAIIFIGRFLFDYINNNNFFLDIYTVSSISNTNNF